MFVPQGKECFANIRPVRTLRGTVRNGVYRHRKACHSSSMAPLASACTRLSNIVVDTTVLKQAVQEARRAGAAVLDCEGQELGSSGTGVLSIVQLLPLDTATPTPYIIDILAFDQDSLQPLLHLLSDAAVSKVMFDCRNDASALWHEWECRLSGVIDLQLLDALVKARTSEQWRKRGWLKQYLKATAAEVKKQEHLYKHIWPLNGLSGSVKKQNVVLNPQLSEHLSSKKQHAPGWSAAWLKRPLDPDLLDYAAADVLTIMELYNHLKMKGHLAAHQREVRDGSDAYAAFYIKQQHERDNPYCNHSLLPMGILQSLSAPAIDKKTGKPYPQKMCSLCLREIPNTCFNQNDTFCYVCRCVAQRLGQR